MSIIMPLAMILAYLLGTIPGAVIIVKLFFKRDISKVGSGNVGAMNSYEVTGKKWVGVLVFLIDALKGALAIIAAKMLSGNDFLVISSSAVMVILGHNYNAFLSFKGGRGLATAVGAFAIINPIFINHWALLWIIGYFVIRKNVHVGNVVASVFTPVLAFSTPDKLLSMFAITGLESYFGLKILVSVICFIIILRHVKPLKELAASLKQDI